MRRLSTAARARLNTQTQDIARFLDSLHEQLAAVTKERGRIAGLEQELEQERARLDAEGMKEWRAKVKDLEGQLHSLLKNFEFQMRETVRAIEDRAAQQKLSKQAEQRIARLRREFSESFNTAVVAQHTGPIAAIRMRSRILCAMSPRATRCGCERWAKRRRCSGRSTTRPSRLPWGR